MHLLSVYNRSECQIDARIFHTFALWDSVHPVVLCGACHTQSPSLTPWPVNVVVTTGGVVKLYLMTLLMGLLFIQTNEHNGGQSVLWVFLG